MGPRHSTLPYFDYIPLHNRVKNTSTTPALGQEKTASVPPGRPRSCENPALAGIILPLVPQYDGSLAWT